MELRLRLRCNIRPRSKGLSDISSQWRLGIHSYSFRSYRIRMSHQRIFLMWRTRQVPAVSSENCIHSDISATFYFIGAVCWQGMRTKRRYRLLCSWRFTGRRQMVQILSDHVLLAVVSAHYLCPKSDASGSSAPHLIGVDQSYTI